MKHYEMILEFKCKTIQKEDRKKIENRKYGLINYDEKIDQNEKIEYPMYKTNNNHEISHSKKNDAIKNINDFLLKLNTENNAICLTNIDDKYFTFIGVTKSDKKENIEELLKKIYEYLQKNINDFFITNIYDDDEIKIIELSENFIYKEISAKEFLIDNVYELVDNYENCIIIQKYFETLNEYNYNVRELGRRKDTLNYDFISSTNIGKKMTKEMLLKKFNSVLYNDNLKKEIDRIYQSKKEENIKFNPFHYEIYEENDGDREEIYKCLGIALYNNKRIKQRYILKLKIDMNDNFVSNKSMKTILKNEEGALVCIEFYVDINNKPGRYEVFDKIRFNELMDIIKEYKDKIEFVFYFDKYQKEMKNQVLESLYEIKLIKIKNVISVDKISEYVDKILKEKNLVRDERLDNLIKTANKKLTGYVINNIINGWQNEKFINIYYPEYKSFIKENTIERNDENAYEKFMSMVGLNNVKKIINQIIDHHKIENLKKEKFLEEKNKSIINSTYKPMIQPLHMAFFGNPGTAKTTVAKLLAKIFYENGLIKSAKCIQYNQEKISLKKAFELAYGGILFIDEAYQYIGMPDFIANLVELMEVNRNDVVVILAGYKNETEAFLYSNPGFESRIKYKITFEDYNEEELWQILKNMAKEKDLIIENESIKEKLMPLFTTAQVKHNLGNGRLIRNILEAANMNKSKRFCKNIEETKKLTYEEINTLTLEDFDIDFESLINVKILDIGKEPKKEFYELIGLTKAKKLIEKIIAEAKINIIRNKLCENRESENLIKNPMHLAFVGNPGTAKTTVARLFARILKEENIIKNPNIVEVGRKNLIGQFVGQTAPLVKKAFDEAKGGILFIDEAYALLDDYKGGYGEEAINTIIQEMENKRNEVIVIFAGYTDRMNEFIANNEGMKSRINYIIEFEDYNSDELTKIFALICKNKKLLYKQNVLKYIKEKFSEITKNSNFKFLGNGRFVRKVVEAAKLNMDYRLSLLKKEKFDKIIINTLTKADVEKAMEELLENINNKKIQKVGFAA